MSSASSWTGSPGSPRSSLTSRGVPLVESARSGDRAAVAKLISLVETGGDGASDALADLFAHTGRAYTIGMTGAPGAGKSTLTDKLIGVIRAGGEEVGVLAIDPTSPFSGGAILGDRVRMQSHAGDDGVFIRSMATRGHLGGLARATGDVALILDASGKDTVIIETVGVGQDEVDIVRTADVSIVTLVPGAGDEVQALKAGIMEIADIFVVNKADREGADRTVASIETVLALHTFAEGEWRPPIVKTEATSGKGIDGLLTAVERFRAHTARSRGERRRARAEYRLRELLSRRFLRHVESAVLGEGELAAVLDRIAARELDPYSAAEDIFGRAAGAVGGAGPVLDHVGVAVADVEAALAFYRDALGLPVAGAEEVASQKVRAHFIGAGATAIELLEATTEESPIAKYLSKRGPGLHHITLCVDDIAAALARLKGRGVRLIDETARPGAHGALVAFVHPASAHGVLVELKQKV